MKQWFGTDEPPNQHAAPDRTGERSFARREGTAAGAWELCVRQRRFLIVSSKDYSDPAEEQEWLDEQEAAALDYLDRESVAHKGELEIEWCVAPHVSVWSLPPQGKKALRTWVICGDLPTDYIQDGRVSDARSAVRTFAERWEDVSRHMLTGKPHPTIRIGQSTEASKLRELGDLLNRRAQLLLKWSQDASVW